MTWGSKVGSDEPGQPMQLSFDAVRDDASVSEVPLFRHAWMRNYTRKCLEAQSQLKGDVSFCALWPTLTGHRVAEAAGGPGLGPKDSAQRCEHSRDDVDGRQMNSARASILGLSSCGFA